MQGTRFEPLVELLEQVIKADELLSTGQDLAALQLLLGTKTQIREAIIPIVVNCVRQKLSAENWIDREVREKELNEVYKLLEFSLLTLCPDCKQQIYLELRK